MDRGRPQVFHSDWYYRFTELKRLGKQASGDSFSSEIEPFLADADFSTKPLMKANSWLYEFRHDGDGYLLAATMYRKGPELMLATLSECAKLYYCHLVRNYYFTELKALHSLLPGPENPSTVKDGQVGGPSLEQYCFLKALDRVEEDQIWLLFNSRLRQFAALIGYHGIPLPDTLSLISALHPTFLDVAMKDEDAKLRKRITELEADNRNKEACIREYDRIRTNLTYRHVLEKLPPPSAKQEGPKWIDFFKKAVDAAMSNDTPLSDIVRTFGAPDKDPNNPLNVAPIKDTGGKLYSVLSTNIHNFKNGIDIKPDQWDILPYEILKAITPLKSSIRNGMVFWDEERARYMIPAPPSSDGSGSTSTLNPAAPSTMAVPSNDGVSAVLTTPQNLSTASNLSAKSQPLAQPKSSKQSKPAAIVSRRTLLDSVESDSSDL